MNAILDFARFLSSGCFVGDLRFILGGFAVVVCVRMFCRGFCAGGGFCLGDIVLGGGLSGDFVRGGGGGGVVGGFCPGGFCPRGIVRGVLSGGFCPGSICPGDFIRGGLSRGVLSTRGGFCSSVGFVRGFCLEVLSGWGLSGGGVCPRITIKCYPINK